MPQPSLVAVRLGVVLWVTFHPGFAPAETSKSPAPAEAVKERRSVTDVQERLRRVRVTAAKLELDRKLVERARLAKKSLDSRKKAALDRLSRRLVAELRKSRKPKQQAFGASMRREMFTDVRVLGIRDADLLVTLLSDDASNRLVRDLEQLVQQVEDTNERVRRQRKELERLREQLSSWPEQRRQAVTWTDADGVVHTEPMTKADARRLRPKLERRLTAAELSSRELVQRLKIEERTTSAALEMLVSVMKAWHDAVSSILENMRG